MAQMIFIIIYTPSVRSRTVCIKHSLQRDRDSLGITEALASRMLSAVCIRKQARSLQLVPQIAKVPEPFVGPSQNSSQIGYDRGSDDTTQRVHSMS